MSKVDCLCEGSDGDALERCSDEELATLVGQGDDKALAVLMRRYKPLVFIKVAPLRGTSRDEAIFVGLEGLYWAVRSYAEAENVSFGEWAARCLNECLANSSWPEEEESVSEDGEADPLMVDLPDAVRERAWSSFSALEKDVFLRYNQGNSYQEIAEALQRPTKSIDNALYRIKRKLEQAVRQS